MSHSSTPDNCVECNENSVMGFTKIGPGLWAVYSLSSRMWTSICGVARQKEIASEGCSICEIFS